MKRILLVMALCGIITTTAFAAPPKKSSFFGRFVSFQTPPPAPAAAPQALPQPLPRPVPHSELSLAPQAVPAPSVTQGAPVELYHCVKVEDRDNIHPCAVTKIVAVRDPCACKSSCCDCCEPGCVYVAICVPPCGCPKVKVSRHGTKVEYDYGKYEVDIKSKNGVVVINYDD